MATALYGPDGFFVGGAGPAAHFRTSVHASPAFATAMLRVLDQLDEALGRPDRLDVVDVGAGRGELLTALVGYAPSGLRRRLRLTAVELAPRPEPLPAEIEWRDVPPDGVTGLLLATEWLDNVPLDVVEPVPRQPVTTGSATPSDPAASRPPAAGDPTGNESAVSDPARSESAVSESVGETAGWRRLMVDPTSGVESPGPAVDPAEAEWLATWWPEAPGGRAELGLSRDIAWAGAVARIHRGLALCVDYGHLAGNRPAGGSLTGFLGGRQVPPIPDGSRDITAHVAIDSAAAAGSVAAGLPYTLLTQREAMRALGADGGRPPLALASTDPAGYVRALAAASAVAELTDPAGLGGHWWLLQPVGVDPATLMARWRT
ncbi:SAM-dependent methyltransferase [Micromonospora polyrhachis]